MPIPKPSSKDEHSAEFMSRCMGDETMLADYGDPKQRAAVCYSQLRNRKPKDRKGASMATTRASSMTTTDAATISGDMTDCPEGEDCQGDPNAGTCTKADCPMASGKAAKPVARSSPSTRAYSVLTLKSINDGERIIHGLASTPDTDHMGDIVESMGAQFRLPIPLLWGHKQDQPVGLVETAEPNARGIPFTARIAKIDEPGELQSLTDKAWQSVKAGLVRGVSIGFSPLDHEPMKSGGLRYKKWAWHELSLVVVPAQANATISLIKQIDTAALLAANGQKQRGIKLTPAGVAAPRKSQKAGPAGSNAMAKKSIADQIGAYEATRVAKAARMDEIMDTAMERGETLDAEEKDEYTGLDSEVKAIDEHLILLHDRERRSLQTATVVDKAVDLTTSTQVRSGVRVSAGPSVLPPGIAFARYCWCFMKSNRNAHYAAQLAKGLGWEDGQRVFEAQATGQMPNMVERIAVAPGTVDDTAWAGPLVYLQNITSEFAEFLRPLTIVGRINGFRRVPFNVKVPVQSTGSSVSWVGETAPKPVSALSFTTVTLGHTKLSGIVPVSDELLRWSNPSVEMIIRNDVAAEISRSMDSAFCDPTITAITNVRPASVTNGVTPITATGTTAAFLRTDLISALNVMNAALYSTNNAVWIMSNQLAQNISLMLNTLGVPLYPSISVEGGTLLGLPVVASETAPTTGNSPTDGGNIILLKADEVLLADDGNVTIDMSNEASLQMETAPDSPATASTTFVSLWQSNMSALRCERYISWVKRRSSGVCTYIQSAKYAA